MAHIITKEENKTSKQEKLIAFYEERLEKVKMMYGNDTRKKGYIEFAEEELEAVKNGRQW